MIEFKPYESKPITRMAIQIDFNKHQVVHINGDEWMITSKGNDTTNIIRFKAHEPVKELDWIVRLTESDTYHCSDVVFRERNIVSE